MSLEQAAGISDPDGFYAAVVALHAGLSVEESLRLCARLIFLLANEVGDAARLAAILAAADPLRAVPPAAP
ncbi:MAG: DUF2783 domain-containing protein [Gammaproteobacteria bacterium]|nr:DUF2783 domain-containing protein [Gammaproteobacteria bacterium]